LSAGCSKFQVAFQFSKLPVLFDSGIRSAIMDPRAYWNFSAPAFRRFPV